jgi:glycosyltransferase involved in cell wall biosynthesis
MRTRVAILSGNHLCHNPRVWKEAVALTDAGYDVEVFGGWYSARLKEQDLALQARAPFKFSPVIDTTQSHGSTRLSTITPRLRGKAGQLAFSLLGVENGWQLGQAVAGLTRAARLSQADLFIAHSEAGMLVAEDLHVRGRRVGIDMEDWFSEDLLPEARVTRPLKLLRKIERHLLQNAVHSSCPSQAMSEAISLEYACRAPVVVYNTFPWADRSALDGLSKDRVRSQAPSIHWYSQTLGPGRGLEDLFAALPLLQHHVSIHLRGRQTRGFAEWMQSRVPERWRTLITLHDLVDSDELLSRIAEHDIGFAGEQTFCRSRDLTVTNKILHYLLGGLAVVASDTAGQREVAAAAPGAVTLYAGGNAASLAAALDRLLSWSAALADARAAALRAAHGPFSWDTSAQRLVRSVEAVPCSTAP